MAEETNNQIGAQEILKLPIAILVLSVLVAIYLMISTLIPAIKTYTIAQGNYKSLIVEQSQKEQKVKSLRDAKNRTKKKEAPSEISKGFYKPLESGADSESAIASEFNEILSLMTANTIKTRSVKYTYDPSDDNFVKGAGNRYSVCKLDMSMIATYNDFKNFMQELYKHEHYLDIAKVEIVPYQKNKNILLIELQLKLYAEKV